MGQTLPLGIEWLTQTRPACLPMCPRSLNKPFFRLALLCLPVALLRAGNAEALGLGRMTVLSTLGKRFEAEVQLVDGQADRTQLAQCFRLGQGNDPDVPTLTRGRINVEERAGRLRLHIVSEQTIGEPVLQVNLRMGCGAETARNYVLLIDPARTRTTPPVVQLPVARPAAAAGSPAREASVKAPTSRKWRVGKNQSARDIARAAFPQKPRAQARFLRDLQAANPGVDLGPRGSARLAPGSVLSLPAGRQAQRAGGRTSEQETALRTAREEQPARKAPARSDRTDRLVISGSADTEPIRPDGELSLRLATRLSPPSLKNTTEDQRAALRHEYQLLSTLRAQAEQQLAVAEKVRSLEAAVNELQSKMASQTGPSEPNRAPNATPNPVAPPAPPAAAPETGKGTDWWLEIALLLGSIGGLTWLLRRRAAKQLPQGGPQELQATPAPLAKAGDPKPDTGWQLQQLSRADSPVLTGDSIAALPGLPAAGQPADRSTEPSASGDDDEVTSVLELAEIMISFGRTAGAAQALKEFVDHKPAAAVTPWLKLLEVYRRSEQREAFDLVGLKLKHHFNVAPPDWDSVGEADVPVLSLRDQDAMSIDQLLEHLPTVKQMPHIAQEISRTWGSPECPAYLDRLLRDNRDGERRGFTLHAVRELLFLIDLQESRLARRR